MRKQQSKRLNRINPDDRIKQFTRNARVLQDPDFACFTKEARADDLARLTKEARALEVEGIDSKNTIIVDILEGSLIEGNSCTIRRIDYTASRNKDWIKAKKANRAKLRDQLPRAFVESPYELRSKLKLIVTKSIVKRIKFSNTIVKMAKAMLVVEVEEELE